MRRNNGTNTCADLDMAELTSRRLFATRRKRPIPDDWASGDDISSFDVKASSEPLYPGSTGVSMDESGDLALFGGTDGVAGVYSISQQKVVDVLRCGTPVTATTWWGSKAIIATSSGTVKVFEAGEEIAQMGSHAGAITSVSLHPSGSLLASAGADKRFIYYDLSTFKSVAQVYTEAEIACCDFHVDGLLFFTGGLDGNIRIFDVKTGVSMAILQSSGPVRDLSFSENGTWFAVAEKGSNSVSVWDLRKQAPIKVIDVGNPVDSIRWDYTGQFLATAGSGSVSVQQYTKATKSWSELVRKAVPARGVAWGASASSLVALTLHGGLSVLSAS
jgi:pre-mRNA-processing factor 19